MTLALLDFFLLQDVYMESIPGFILSRELEKKVVTQQISVS
jgi:hypothetical protein